MFTIVFLISAILYLPKERPTSDIYNPIVTIVIAEIRYLSYYYYILISRTDIQNILVDICSCIEHIQPQVNKP